MGYVYKITNTINGKQYIGKTMGTIENRWNNHIKGAKGNYNSKLSNAIRKYGENAFKVSILEESENELYLFEKERYWINQANSFGENGYNLTEGGEGALGYRHYEEVKIKLRDLASKTHKGRQFTEEHRKNLSKAMKGNKNMLGKRHSEESKLKMSEATKGKQKSSPTIETRQKLSKANTGKKRSEETKLKLSEARKRWWINRKLENREK